MWAIKGRYSQAMKDNDPVVWAQSSDGKLSLSLLVVCCHTQLFSFLSYYNRMAFPSVVDQNLLGHLHQQKMFLHHKILFIGFLLDLFRKSLSPLWKFLSILLIGPTVIFACLIPNTWHFWRQPRPC